MATHQLPAVSDAQRTPACLEQGAVPWAARGLEQAHTRMGIELGLQMPKRTAHLREARRLASCKWRHGKGAGPRKQRPPDAPVDGGVVDVARHAPCVKRKHLKVCSEGWEERPCGVARAGRKKAPIAAARAARRTRAHAAAATPEQGRCRRAAGPHGAHRAAGPPEQGMRHQRRHRGRGPLRRHPILELWVVDHLDARLWDLGYFRRLLRRCWGWAARRGCCCVDPSRLVPHRFRWRRRRRRGAEGAPHLQQPARRHQLLRPHAPQARRATCRRMAGVGFEGFFNRSTGSARVQCATARSIFFRAACGCARRARTVRQAEHADVRAGPHEVAE